MWLPNSLQFYANDIQYELKAIADVYQQKYISHLNPNFIYLLNLLGVLWKRFSLTKFDRGRKIPYGK